MGLQRRWESWRSELSETSTVNSRRSPAEHALIDTGNRRLIMGRLAALGAALLAVSGQAAAASQPRRSLLQGSSDASTSETNVNTDATINVHQLGPLQQNPQCPFTMTEGFVDTFQGPRLDTNLWFTEQGGGMIQKSRSCGDAGSPCTMGLEENIRTGVPLPERAHHPVGYAIFLLYFHFAPNQRLCVVSLMQHATQELPISTFASFPSSCRGPRWSGARALGAAVPGVPWHLLSGQCLRHVVRGPPGHPGLHSLRGRHDRWVLAAPGAALYSTSASARAKLARTRSACRPIARRRDVTPEPAGTKHPPNSHSGPPLPNSRRVHAGHPRGQRRHLLLGARGEPGRHRPRQRPQRGAPPNHLPRFFATVNSLRPPGPHPPL